MATKTRIGIIIALYFIVRVLYWFNWAEYGEEKMWSDITYHVNQYMLPINLMIIFFPVCRFWLGYGIAGLAFMMIYSVLCRYSPAFNNITDIHITGIFIAYSLMIFLLLSLRIRK